MQIKTAEFIVSNQEVFKCPNNQIPEYAFIGRSNVGKSSLINMLTNQKRLAKTSGRPGKTQLINHFLINKEWFLVDLPGYGYARVSKSAKKIFQKFITTYFKERKQLVSAFVLVDIRHEPQSVDLAFMQWLGEYEIPFSIIFTKADKLRPKAIEKHIQSYKNKLLEFWEEMPNYFTTSSTNYLGKEALLNYISGVNNELSIKTNKSPFQ
ncbi:MAG: YihA family ribosome biogenesis GTP-binding protein [Formosa sp.]|jgi:GTP-binding protein|nr:YihA family ribosome biogenesis GTP-binding protein [Formosa sp.]MDC0462659.1 ribosome biogenesis GTP-binding protein YihA/YsxC [Flavobacteriaceae bacterium]MDC3351095.1 ribosome biogenesis GTP-binding protein YihA/YsxC [Flavobacteriaceae bacterium]|tara:strand:- start:2416 stop:3042 length:627 start_codon:yes stop_codon:yes gene_type:complete